MSPKRVPVMRPLAIAFLLITVTACSPQASRVNVAVATAAPTITTAVTVAPTTSAVATVAPTITTAASPTVTREAPQASSTPSPTAIPPTATALPKPEAPSPPAGSAEAGAYAIGQPTLTELYVSPSGNDGNTGLGLDAPLRTLTAAWGKIPAGAALATTGYRINLLPGTFPCEPDEPDNCQNYFADRLGAYRFPIILRAYKGPGTVTIRGGFDFNHVAYLYLLDLTLAGGMPLPTNASGNNLLHLSDADHVLLRGLVLAGPDCATDACNNLQEVLKVNQAQHLYVEDSVIGGGWHSAVDFFSVQYGHFTGNRLHTAGQWCMYVKGGTAYLRVEGNELHDCQLGFQAGQSSNLAMMRAPWIHYEAYDVKFVNNVLHDLPGVALSVSGGYNILLAYNSLIRVGGSADPGYALVQTVQGERGCNATDELPAPVPVCTKLTQQGGWGPNVLAENTPAIPNRNIYVYNNLIYNPAPVQTLYTHFGIQGPIDLPAGFVNLPASVATDENLVIAGNLIWNGPADHPLGIEESSGCLSSNPTCNAGQLTSRNTINVVEPRLVNPAAGDYHPAAGGNVFRVASYPVPDFTWDAFAPAVPRGTLSNTVSRDRDGKPRQSSGPPGAYASNAP